MAITAAVIITTVCLPPRPPPRPPRRHHHHRHHHHHAVTVAALFTPRPSTSARRHYCRHHHRQRAPPLFCRTIAAAIVHHYLLLLPLPRPEGGIGARISEKDQEEKKVLEKAKADKHYFISGVRKEKTVFCKLWYGSMKPPLLENRWHGMGKKWNCLVLLVLMN